MLKASSRTMLLKCIRNPQWFGQSAQASKRVVSFNTVEEKVKNSKQLIRNPADCMGASLNTCCRRHLPSNTRCYRLSTEIVRLVCVSACFQHADTQTNRTQTNRTEEKAKTLSVPLQSTKPLLIRLSTKIVRGARMSMSRS